MISTINKANLAFSIIAGAFILLLLFTSLIVGESFLSSHMTWLGFAIIISLIAVNILYVTYNKKQEADSANQEKEEQKSLFSVIDNYNKARSEISELNNKLTVTERKLSEMTEYTEWLKTNRAAVVSECIKLDKQIKDKDLAIKQMVRKLGALAQMIHEQPAPVTLSGSDLKSIRFETLRIAIIGFDGLEDYAWRHLDGIEPQMYRDFVHASLGEETISPTQPWAAEMILAAHKNSGAEKPAA